MIGRPGQLRAVAGIEDAGQRLGAVDDQGLHAAHALIDHLGGDLFVMGVVQRGDDERVGHPDGRAVMHVTVGEQERVGAGIRLVLALSVVLLNLVEEERVEDLILQAVRGEAHDEGRRALLVGGLKGRLKLADAGLDEGRPMRQLAIGVPDGVARVGEGRADEGRVAHRGVHEEGAQGARRQGLDGPSGHVHVPVDAVGADGERQDGGDQERDEEPGDESHGSRVAHAPHHRPSGRVVTAPIECRRRAECGA